MWRLQVRHYTPDSIILRPQSSAGVYPQAATPVYAAVKAAVIHFTRSLAFLQAESSVRVVAIAPSFFDTPFLTGFRDTVETISPIMTVSTVIDAAHRALVDESVRFDDFFAVRKLTLVTEAVTYCLFSPTGQHRGPK